MNDNLSETDDTSSDEEQMQLLGKTKCLFSEKVFDSPEMCLENDQQEHGFDLKVRKRNIHAAFQ